MRGGGGGKNVARLVVVVALKLFLPQSRPLASLVLKLD